MKLENLTKLQLQQLCMRLGMGVDLLWNKEQMLYLITERKEILQSVVDNAEQDLQHYNTMVDYSLKEE